MKKIKIKSIKIAIIGVTGLVGKKLVQIFENYSNLKADNFSFFSSKSRRGTFILFKGSKICLEFFPDRLKDIYFDIVFLCTKDSISKKYEDILRKSGSFIIDNSSQFRLQEGIPLIIPEINASEIKENHSLISSPNCIVSILLTGLLPILKRFSIQKLILSTYQSVSGAGYYGVQDLESQIIGYVEKRKIRPSYFKYPIAFNLFSHDSSVNSLTGMNNEEEKIVLEIKKILNQGDLPINITCVRVPILFCHSISVYMELKKEVDILQVKEDILNYSELVLKDDPEENNYPMPIDATNKKEIYVGRLRKDIHNKKAMNMWIVGDQLVKGSAWNLFQIARIKFDI